MSLKEKPILIAILSSLATVVVIGVVFWLLNGLKTTPPADDMNNYINTYQARKERRERKRVHPNLEKSKQLVAELEQVKKDRERISQIWKRIQSKGQATSHPSARKEKPMITLADLKNTGELRIKFTGNSRPAELSRQDCVYSEIVYGQKNDRGWVSYSIHHSSDPVVIDTEKGPLELPVNTLRLFINPVYAQIVTAQNLKTFPDVVRELFTKEEQPHMHLEEYCLARETGYNALISMETYYLPPETPGSEPVERQNAVLWVSDLTFTDGKPQRPLTPHFRGITY